MRVYSIQGRSIALSVFIIAFALFSVIVFAQNGQNESLPTVDEIQSPLEEEGGDTDSGEDVQDEIEEETNAGGDSGEDVLDEDEKEFGEVELNKGAGFTPDNFFYFIDTFFDRFGSDLENRQEKISEIKAMIAAGKIDEAREALSQYKEYADNVEKDIDPERQEEARRSAVAIKRAMREIENDIPQENRDEFVHDIIEKEGEIAAAAKIANKIQQLCETLSKLDPLQYSRVCRTDENAPRWQRRLDEKLTGEQREEAEKFFEIMSDCFRNPATCRCEEISVTAFADKCKIVAPLAAKCEQEEDEKACEQMDEETEGIEDLLPEHLQDVLQSVEEEFGEAEFDNHMPPECREAGIDFRDRDAREKCMRIMFKVHAPEECVKALEEGKIDPSNEREAREQCENIMFEANAPPECIEAGLKDHRECGKFMFQQSAPQECKDAGLTGESPSDGRRCGEIMRQIGGDGQGPGGMGPPAFGRNCKEILDSAEKLKCLEEFYSHAQQGGFPGQGSPGGFGSSSGMFPPECKSAGALTRESCEKIMTEASQRRADQNRGYQENFASSCREKGGRWDCSFSGVTPGEPCRCFFDDNNRGDPYSNNERYREEYQRPSGESQPPQGCDCRNVICSSGSYPMCKPGSTSCGCVSFEHFERQPMPPPTSEQSPATEQPGSQSTQPASPTTTEPLPTQPATGDTSSGSSSGTSGGSSGESGGSSGPSGDTSATGISTSANRFLRYRFRLL